MKKLYLLRHAESSRPKGVSDHERPINENGKKACKAMNAYILENKITPGVVLCSDAVRTMSTAKGIFAGRSDVNIAANKKLYNSTPGEILKEIAKIPDYVSSIMVVAHNPGIPQLAFILARQEDRGALIEIKTEYPTCALTEYSFNIEKWKDLEPGLGKFERLVK